MKCNWKVYCRMGLIKTINCKEKWYSVAKMTLLQSLFLFGTFLFTSCFKVRAFYLKSSTG